jgi:hypothetical protein
MLENKFFQGKTLKSSKGDKNKTTNFECDRMA